MGGYLPLLTSKFTTLKDCLLCSCSHLADLFDLTFSFRFGMQLFGELDYVREATNCERFRELYGGWKNVMVPDVCTPLTRKKVLVMEWVDGTKGPWPGDDGIKMVRIGLRCSVDQLVSSLL